MAPRRSATSTMAITMRAMTISGALRNLMAPVDLREESRNIALASHGQSRAADSGQ